MRAAGYFRVSTARQGSEDHFSLPVQLELYEARCRAKGYTPTGSPYVDTDSGRKATRRGYQRLLADARAGLFDVIVVRSIDRFGRDQDEIAVATAELRQAHVRIDPVYTSVQEGTPPTMAKFLGAIEAFLAEQESVQISGRVRDTMAASARAGRWQGGPAPYGYRVEAGRLAVQEGEAGVVRRIFGWYADENLGARAIAVRLNAAGVRSRSGGRWAMQTVRDILRREAYLGTLCWRDVRVAGAHEAIIDRETWERVQARSRTRARLPAGRTHTSDYMLSGAVWCACGARMVGRRSGAQRGYVCRRWQDGGSDHGSNWHGAPDLEARVLADLALVEPRSGDGIPSTAALDVERATVQAELDAVTGRSRRLFDAFSREVITEAEFTREVGRVREDEARTRQRLAAIEHDRADIERTLAEIAAHPGRLKALADDGMSAQEKKAALHAYGLRVVVYSANPEPEISISR